RPGSYYEENAYPFRAVQQAGGILVAGSDAPVETRDPRPFVNMARAVTRRYPDRPALNPRQAITIREVLDAYTIGGARFLGREKEIGSLEVGKAADFVVLDRDILKLSDGGEPLKVADAQVLETWFAGNPIYTRHAGQVQPPPQKMVGADGLEPPTRVGEDIAALEPAPAVAGAHRATRLR